MDSIKLLYWIFIFCYLLGCKEQSPCDSVKIEPCSKNLLDSVLTAENSHIEPNKLDNIVVNYLKVSSLKSLSQKIDTTYYSDYEPKKDSSSEKLIVFTNFLNSIKKATCVKFKKCIIYDKETSNSDLLVIYMDFLYYVHNATHGFEFKYYIDNDSNLQDGNFIQIEYDGTDYYVEKTESLKNAFRSIVEYVYSADMKSKYPSGRPPWSK